METEYRVLIDGELVRSSSEKTMEIVNPADGKSFAQVPQCDPEEMNKAITAAEKAFPAWSGKSISDRARYLIKLGEIIRSHYEELAILETRQYGGPLWKTRNFDIPFAWELLQYYAGIARAMTGESLPTGPTCSATLYREPLGVVGLITPWNFPLVTVLSKLAPALVTGNTCVVKPPSVAPLTALKLGRYVMEAGFPAGVVNILTGPGATIGEALVKDPRVAKIAFTGDSFTGKRIMSLASDTVKPLAMELGGKNAFIVMEDADIPAAIEGAVWSAFFNSGQNCGSPSRFLVQEAVYDRFVEAFVAAAQTVKLGDPMDLETMIGPLAYKGHRDTVERFINIAQKEGARLLLGGKRPNIAGTRNGFFVAPTIFDNCDNKMTFMREEIFGPVVGITKFKTAEEALAIANDTHYGLCASIWTHDLRKGMLMARQLNVGTAWLNQHLSIIFEVPWGGVKESGFGKENSHLCLHEYTRIKNIWVDLVGNPATPWQGKLPVTKSV